MTSDDVRHIGRSSETQITPAAASNPLLIVPKLLPLSLILALATFNVRGLSKEVDQHILGRDYSI